MNRNPPYTEASVTKQEKTALNMARFIRSQTLTLLEKLNELDADEQADICRGGTQPQPHHAGASWPRGIQPTRPARRCSSLASSLACPLSSVISCICLFPVGRYSTKQQGSSAFPLHNPASGSL
ncbi:Rop family plasmid primer RNA-binding protein [Acinetobacter baumannii]|uniref:Rop family plasmid primer RNA-binding protein n=1 Tax=Acinetobacter baumannii TaxID=470 RepID=UPI004047019A